MLKISFICVLVYYLTVSTVERVEGSVEILKSTVKDYTGDEGLTKDKTLKDENSQNIKFKEILKGPLEAFCDTYNKKLNGFVDGAEIARVKKLSQDMSKYLSQGLSLALMKAAATFSNLPLNEFLGEVGTYGRMIDEQNSIQGLGNIAGEVQNAYKESYSTAYAIKQKDIGKPLVNYGELIELSKKVGKFSNKEKIFIDFWSDGPDRRISNRLKSQNAYFLAQEKAKGIAFENYVIYSPRSDKVSELIESKLTAQQLEWVDFGSIIIQLPRGVKKSTDPQLIFEQGDTVVVGRKYIDLNEGEVAILDFADAHEPGAGWMYWDGASTQEESVCRQTDLFFRLNYIANTVYKDALLDKCPHNKDDEAKCPKFDVPEQGVIFLKDVQILFEPKKDTPWILTPTNPDHIPRINVIVSAALDYSFDTWSTEGPSADKRMDAENLGDPERAARVIAKYQMRNIVQPPKNSPDYEEIQKSKIRAQLYSAIANGIKIIILGQQGGGAFENDNQVVAKLYAQVLFDEEMIFYFDKVIFHDLKSKPVAYMETFAQYLMKKYVKPKEPVPVFSGQHRKQKNYPYVRQYPGR